MSVTKDGFYNIEGKMFEVVHGVEGDCLTLGDEDGGTRISGPKPWGGGQVTKTFVTQEKYGPIERLEAENAKLRELVSKNWYIALSAREALRAHDIDPDGGTYMAALDDEIATAKYSMHELGVEVDE
jgi:hypothetical protein